MGEDGSITTDTFTIKSYYEVIVKQLAESALEDHEILPNFLYKKTWMKSILSKVPLFSIISHLNLIQMEDKLIPAGVDVEDMCLAMRVGRPPIIYLCNVQELRMF